MGEYVSITSGEAPSKFEEGTELYVKVDDLNYNDKYVVDTQNKVAEHSTVKRATKGSVVFPKRGAAIITNKVRILGIDSYMDTNMMALTSERLDSEFLYNIISKEGLYKIADTSTIPQINNKHIEPYEVKIPSLDEQRRIGVYFKQLDHLITLHQRKFEKLTNVKKSMLEKMFPQNGSSYPEIRFKGFTDPWEQRKLSEIADKVTEKNAGLQYVETFTNSAEFGIISQRDFFDHDIAKLGSLDGYYIVKNEDFVYNPRISTSAPVGPINRNKLGRTGVMSPLYTVFRPHDVDTTYLEHFFKCAYWHSFMNFNGDSGARSDRFSIKDDVFFQMPIPLPYIDEQRKIGELLTRLDHLITLHQRELEKLQNIKKSMLEKMFV